MSHERDFMAALQRPWNYHELSHERQWAIDKALGLLDWEGPRTDAEWNRLRRHHRLTRPDEPIDELSWQ